MLSKFNYYSPHVIDLKYTSGALTSNIVFASFEVSSLHSYFLSSYSHKKVIKNDFQISWLTFLKSIDNFYFSPTVFAGRKILVGGRASRRQRLRQPVLLHWLVHRQTLRDWLQWLCGNQLVSDKARMKLFKLSFCNRLT